MSTETNAVDPLKSWTPEQNATIDGLQQKLGWSRVQAIHKLRQGEKVGKTPAQVLAEATAPKQKPAAKANAKPESKAKREPKAKKSVGPKEPAFSTKSAGKGDAYMIEGRGGKYDKQLVVNLYMDGGKTPSEIAALDLAGLKGISPVYCHRILFGNEESGGINKGQAARRKEQAARVKAWAQEKVNAKKAEK